MELSKILVDIEASGIQGLYEKVRQLNQLLEEADKIITELNNSSIEVKCTLKE